ncbi:MAG: bifunctional oligoribonuclease/PAP phosphatase NrnA [Candidatus Borkfalkiaceae bacterium]|nr:bifunctional oligoribonuclease/PAP phosphatase NrnA [Christensenellaceae bacterium]
MTINEITAKLFSYDSYLIFCHARPDGDTLGSAFALKIALENRGKRADIVCESAVPAKFDFMPLSGSVLLPSAVSGSYAAHVAVDCASENMIGEAFSLFSRSKNTFNIDHHLSNSRYAAYNLVGENAACCEIIYDIITLAGVKIDDGAANSLLLGISTDTGNFMHSNVTANTLSVAAKLVELGGDLHNIAYNAYKNQPLCRAKLYAKVMDGMRLFADGKIAVISVFSRQIEEFGASKDMTEGFIDFPLSVSGVEVAVSIMENKENCYKVSLRSKGKVNVNEVAAAFGGGGHVLASGCMISGFYEDVKDKLIREISFQLD